MTGKLDQPLGVSRAEKPARKWCHAAYAIVFIFFGISGFSIVRSIKSSTLNLTENNQGDASVKLALSRNVDAQSAADERESPAEGTLLSPLDKTASIFQKSESVGILPITPGARRADLKRIPVHLPDMELIEKTSVGLLPVKSPDGLRPLDVYSRKPDTEGNFGVARIVVIVGGLGISQTSTEQAIRLLPPGVTLAFAPYGNSLSRWMRAARKAGHELLLQIPMEPFDYPRTNAGKHSLLTSFDKQENHANLRWVLGRITNYVGVMNYLGGKMLTSPTSLLPVFEELAHRGLMFVDDGSIRNSMAMRLSRSANLPFSRVHIKIDAIRSRAHIAKRLKELAAKARRTGLAVGIATAFPESVSLIAAFLRDEESRGLELTPVSAIAIEHRG